MFSWQAGRSAVLVLLGFTIVCVCVLLFLDQRVHPDKSVVLFPSPVYVFRLRL